jgi:membrane fusion protein, heavy metal efflux system
MTKHILSLLLLLSALTAYAHGDDDHGGTMEKKSAGKPYFTVTGTSGLFELVLKYFPVEASQPAHMKLFVSDFETNEPVARADIRVTAQEDPDIKFNVQPLEPGIYEVEGTFPSNRSYALAVSISSPKGPDLLAIRSVEVGKNLPVEESPADHDGEHGKMSLLLWIGAGFAGGILVTLLLMRGKRSRKGRLTVVTVVLCMISLPMQLNQPAFAHGDDGHGEEEHAGGYTAEEVEVLKESQFLYGMRTKLSSYGNYVSSLKLYGRVIADINGLSEITAPQQGTLSSILVRVGEKVRKGQPLAVFEQTLGAADQLQYTTSRNNAMAELENAQRNYERLQKIRDIVAQKDLLTAETRLRNAEKNMESFSSSRKTYTITSPIDGQVDNFTLSTGSPILQGQLMFRVVKMDRVRIEAQVFDKDIQKIDGKAHFLVECVQENHRTEEAKLISFGNVVNPVNQSSQVILEVDNAEDLFKLGQFATVYVMVKNDKKQLTVPAASLSDINGKPVVFTHTAPELFKVRYVKTGAASSYEVVIESGLEEHERVVTEGAYQLKSIYMNQ